MHVSPAANLRNYRTYLHYTRHWDLNQKQSGKFAFRLNRSDVNPTSCRAQIEHLSLPNFLWSQMDPFRVVTICPRKFSFSILPSTYTLFSKWSFIVTFCNQNVPRVCVSSPVLKVRTISTPLMSYFHQ